MPCNDNDNIQRYGNYISQRHTVLCMAKDIEQRLIRRLFTIKKKRDKSVLSKVRVHEKQFRAWFRMFHMLRGFPLKVAVFPFGIVCQFHKSTDFFQVH